MEGVLVPEIWIAFSEASGIPELRRTTRDEPDYDKLMTWRLGILKEHGLGLKEIQDTIAKIDPLPGAKAFLDELRATTQVIILSDTFEEFAKPLMEKLGWPTIFCNSLEVAENGEITGYKMRCEKSKLTTVKALQSIGYDTIASGDSFNDLGMIQASKAGFLFKSTEQIKADHPEIPAFEEFDDLLAAIKAALWPTTPPPKTNTLPGFTPGTPPSNTPLPPCGFSRKRAPSCTDMRPATSLIGIKRGNV